MNAALWTLVGATFLLIYSLERLSKNVLFVLGSKFRFWLHKASNNRFKAFVLGFILSILLGSSSTVTVMLVSICSAKLISLENVLSVSLGAGVGTTLIVHLVTADFISSYSWIFISLGVFGEFLSARRSWAKFNRVFLYLGLILLCLKAIVDSGSFLESHSNYGHIINFFKDRPLFSFLLSGVITAVIHSSAALISILLSLALTHEMNLAQAVPWILGANIGTTFTAFFHSLHGGGLGQKASLSNVITKVATLVIILPFLPMFIQGVEKLHRDSLSQIAFFHTYFNCIAACLFLPWVNVFVISMEYLMPGRRRQDKFSYLFIENTRPLISPNEALKLAHKEIARLTDIVIAMVGESLDLFREGSLRQIYLLKDQDRFVDFLNKGVKRYLTQLSLHEMGSLQKQIELQCLMRTQDLENIGDIIDKNILELVLKIRKKGYSFSEQGWNELKDLHQRVIDVVKLSKNYFEYRDESNGEKMIEAYEKTHMLAKKYCSNHLMRLHHGVLQSVESSSIHLDLIGYFQRVCDLAVQFTGQSEKETIKARMKLKNSNQREAT